MSNTTQPSNFIDQLSSNYLQEKAARTELVINDILAEHGFKSIQEAQNNGYDFILSEKGNEQTIKLVKVVDSVTLTF